jgi:hypothetical protein
LYKRDNRRHVYTVDSLTRIIVKGKPGALTNITAGLQVKDYVERDNNTLENITVDKASPPPK